MSTRKTPPSARKPAQAPAPSRRSVPVAARPPARTTSGPRRDQFGLYFILGSAAVILLFGVAVWGVRSLIAGSPPAPTATPELLTALPRAADNETPLPLTPPPTPTLPAPDAIHSGAFAPSAPIESVVITDSSQVREPAHLPAVIPQAVLDLSETSVFFGSVQPNAVLTHELTLANKGARDLNITQLATSCACVSVWVDSPKLPSGTRTRMIVTYTEALDRNEPGFTSEHTLFLATTDGQNPLTKLTVSAVLP